MPDLIRAGRVYKGVPPLYGVKIGKKIKYFVDTLDYTRYNQAIFSKSNIITTMSNRKLTNNEAIDLFIRNIDLVYELEIVSNTYAINPFLLESILVEYCNENQSIEYKTFKKAIEKKYRFLKVSHKNDIVIVSGLVDSKYQTIFLNDKLLRDCSKTIEILSNNSTDKYKVNGQAVTLYQLMKAYESSQPRNVTRYKGLGEMNPMQLAESTLYNDNRTLMRYTIEDVIQEIEAIRYIESNKDILLKNVNVKRQDID